jgi:hypothetical protein
LLFYEQHPELWRTGPNGNQDWKFFGKVWKSEDAKTEGQVECRRGMTDRGGSRNGVVEWSDEQWEGNEEVQKNDY